MSMVPTAVSNYMKIQVRYQGDPNDRLPEEEDLKTLLQVSSAFIEYWQL